MKKLYSFAAAAAIGAFTYVAEAQEQEYTILEDLTASKIVNADFTADVPVNRLVRTYAKDLADEGLGNGGEELYGMQPVTGWVASAPTDNIKNDPSAVSGDARAAAVFAYLDEGDEGADAKLGGEYYPPYAYDVEVHTGNALGMVGVWTGTVQYTQDVTLAPGAYELVVPVTNTAGNSAVVKNLIGFISDAGVEYLATNTTFEIGQRNISVVFVLKEETSGKISLGYQGANVGSGSAPHIFIDAVNLYSIDATPIIQKEIDDAKEILIGIINEGEQVGADIAAAMDVYDNPNATLEEVNAAIESQKVLNETSVTDLSEFFIRNPHFNTGTPIVGGVTTYDYDMSKNGVENYSMQPVPNWTATSTDNARAAGLFELGGDAFLGGPGYLTPETLSDGSTEGNLLGFISVWSAQSQYTQAVTIPAGKYTLTISYYNAGGTGAIGKNLMGFIANDGTEYFAEETQFVEKKWNKMKIFFELDEQQSGKFSVGYTAANAGSGSMPHLFIDGIALNYVGEANFDASLMALSSTIESAKEIDEFSFYTELKEELEKAIDEAEELKATQSDDKDANIAATNKLNELIEAANANIEAYEKLEEFASEVLQPTCDKYECAEGDLMYDLYDNLVLLYEEIDMEVLSDYTWSTQQINDTIASLQPTILAYTKAAWDKVVEKGEVMDEPLNITPLLSGLAYTYSTTAQSNTNVPDKEWAYGEASNFKTQYGTAEVWNQSPFTVARTLSDMPAGTYTITTKAFYRTSDNDTNYSNYVGGDTADKAFVFAGHAKKGLTNVALLASETGEGYTNPATLSDGLLVPNNQQTAHDVFESADFAEKVTTSVKTVLTEAGDLNFGITADQMEGNSWVVWYSFEVAYNGIEEDVLADEINGLIAEATTKQEIDEVLANEKATNNLEVAIANGETAIEGDIEAKKASIAELTAAIEYADKAVTLTNKAKNDAAAFTAILENNPVAADSSELQDVLDAADSGEYESNEQIEKLIAALPVAWAKYVLGQDLSSASEDEPVDVTAAIINADFSMENANFWTITPAVADAPIGQNQGYQNNNIYKNEEKEIEVNQFIETWRPDGAVLNDGIIGQEIAAALPAGYYILSADAYAVNQKAVPEDGVQGAYLVAITGNDTICTSIGLDAATPENFEVVFKVDGSALTTVGLLIEGTNASWAVADNFKLMYVGGKAPEGVGIESEIADANSAKVAGIYSINGSKVAKAAKGLNIVKMSDGTVQKLFIAK